MKNPNFLERLGKAILEGEAYTTITVVIGFICVLASPFVHSSAGLGPQANYLGVGSA